MVSETSASPSDDVARRAERAAHLARLGESAAARQTLIAELLASLAPLSDSTLRELTDPVRRCPGSYWICSPMHQLRLIEPLCSRARKGSAPRPTGYAATRPKCSASFSMMKRRHLCLPMLRRSSPELRCLLSPLQLPWDDLLLFASLLEEPVGWLRSAGETCRPHLGSTILEAA